MTESEWEYRSVRIPAYDQWRRGRALNRLARDGWELVESRSGGLISARDVATFRRRKQAKRSLFSPRQAEHSHDWEDRTTPDDARNGVTFKVCTGCGQGVTEPA